MSAVVKSCISWIFGMVSASRTWVKATYWEKRDKRRGKVQETKQLTGVVNHTLCTCSSLVDLRWQSLVGIREYTPFLIESRISSGVSVELKAHDIGAHELSDVERDLKQLELTFLIPAGIWRSGSWRRTDTKIYVMEIEWPAIASWKRKSQSSKNVFQIEQLVMVRWALTFQSSAHVLSLAVQS